MYFPIKNRWHVFLESIWCMIDPRWCISLDQLMCMPYACASSKWRELLCISGLHLLMWEVAIVLQISPSNLCRGVASGPNLSLTRDHMSSSCSLDFGVVQWSWCRNCSGQNLLLLSTLHPCRFSFNMQVMILMRSYYGLSSPAVASVDGCCLYIIIHNSISHVEPDCKGWQCTNLAGWHQKK